LGGDDVSLPVVVLAGGQIRMAGAQAKTGLDLFGGASAEQMQSRLHLGQGDLKKGVEIAGDEVSLDEPAVGAEAAEAPALRLHHQAVGGAGS
jgi:hypothetical protein